MYAHINRKSEEMKINERGEKERMRGGERIKEMGRGDYERRGERRI